MRTCAYPEWGGGPDPLKIYKNTEFLGNAGTDPLKLSKRSKLPSQHSMLGQHRHASEAQFFFIDDEKKNVDRVA